jgi:prefoldin subunit 5
MKATVARVSAIAFLFAAAMGGSVFGRAQQTTTPPDTLAALMVEVRGLRAAMEQMASAGSSVQLALGRVQLQEQRIANQIRRLDTVTANLAAAKKALEPVEEHLNALKEGGNDPVDAENRRAREWELMSVKKEWARMNAEVQRLANEENILAQDVATEQNRWADFNQRLEDLERALRR